jgi:hypothetical protein
MKTRKLPMWMGCIEAALTPPVALAGPAPHFKGVLVIQAICGGTGASSAGTNMAFAGTDTISAGTEMISAGTEMISAGTNKAFVTAHRASVAALRMAHRCTTIAAILLCGMFCASVRAQCTPVWSALGSGVNGRVYAMTVLPGGDVIVGGYFTSAGGVPADSIARYNPSTGVWSRLGFGTNGSVRAIAVLPGGDVIASGSFFSAGGVAAGNIARYNPGTNVWSAMGSGLSGSITWPVNALAVLPGGDVIVGGDFSTAGGVAANNIARYNPSTGSWSALGSGTDSTVLALAFLPGGDVIVGGGFSTAGGVRASRIARYNPSTGVWSRLGGGAGGADYALAVKPGGAGEDLIVGGYLSLGGSVAVNHIARYTPSTGVWSAMGSGVNGTTASVRALAVLPEGDVIVGGQFSTAGGAPASNIARYTPSTGIWSAMGTGISGSDSIVYALAVLPGGDMIAGGQFASAGGVAASRIARYSLGSAAPSVAAPPSSQTACPGSTVTFSTSAAGASPITYQWLKGGVPLDAAANPTAATPTLTLTNVQAADAASYSCMLTNICGSVTSNAALLTLVSCGGCSLADIAGGGPDGRSSNGIIDGTDYIAFVNSFAIGDATVDPLADIAGGGDTGLELDGTIDGTDFIFFINAFAIGC